MPTRLVTVWTCSTCPVESAERLNHYELTGPGGARSYDLCDDCRDTNPTFRAFLELGEKRSPSRAGSRSRKRPSTASAPVITTAAKASTTKTAASKPAAAKPVAKKSTVKPRRTKAGLVCPECSATYPTERSLAQHRSRVHAVASKTALMMSKRGRTGNLKCPDCDFRTTAGQGLAAHRRHAHAA